MKTSQIIAEVQSAASVLGWKSLHMLAEALAGGAGHHGADDGYNMSVVHNGTTLKGGCSYGSHISANLETGEWDCSSCGGHFVGRHVYGLVTDDKPSLLSWGDGEQPSCVQRLRRAFRQVPISQCDIVSAMAADTENAERARFEKWKKSYRGTRMNSAARKAGFGQFVA